MRSDAAMASLAQMQDLLKHRDDQVVEEPVVFVPEASAASAGAGGAGALALGGVWRKPGFGFTAELSPGIFLYFHGEAYDDAGCLSTEAIAARFAELPLVRGEWNAIAHMDGHYSAAIADTGRGALHLITDPMGLRPLYVRETAGALWFAGELKGLLGMGALEIDRLAASDFLRLGHFLGDATWFQGVRLLPPACHMRYDLATGRMLLSQYRAWPPDGRREGDEALAALLIAGRATDSQRASQVIGELLQKAVLRRLSHRQRMGMLLSGGLDSRTLFAAYPSDWEPPSILTFGKPGSRDIEIALRVSAIRPTHHDIVEIDQAQGLADRESDVWLTDGQLALHHMHGVQSWSKLESTMDICLHGFLGSALLGGDYLGDNRWTIWEKYLHRGRRFVLAALNHGQCGIRFRMPFLDLKLVEALSVLPEALLRDGKLYRLILLQRWPEFFTRIPWKKTGLALTLNPGRERLRQNSRKLGRGLLKLLGSSSRARGADSEDFLDAAKWMREEKGRAFVEATLFPEGGTALDALVDAKIMRKQWDAHLAGRDYAEILGRYLTAAIWLREVNQRVKASARTPESHA